MSNIGRQIEFRSLDFPRCERDAELANCESMFGYALARHIADELPDYGFTVEEQVGEDWGWWSGIENSGYELSYACRCDNETGDFVIFAHPATPVIRRWFRKIDVSGRLNPLNEAIFNILAASGKATSGPNWVD